MKAQPIKAVICDVYHTLLSVEVIPADEGDELWRQFSRSRSRCERFPSLDEIERATALEIARRHAVRRAGGELFPEIDWPDVLAGVLPAPASRWVTAEKLAIADGHARCLRRTALMPGAAPFLRRCAHGGLALGLASNAQAYTRRELRDALDAAGLSDDHFSPDLTFLSYERGFSKPSPAVFGWLSERLARRGIAPAETLMVGDRVDNDIAPAEAAGWKTWRLCPSAPADESGCAGSWSALGKTLFGPDNAAQTVAGSWKER